MDFSHVSYRDRVVFLLSLMAVVAAYDHGVRGDEMTLDLCLEQSCRAVLLVSFTVPPRAVRMGCGVLEVVKTSANDGTMYVLRAPLSNRVQHSRPSTQIISRMLPIASPS